MTEKTGTGHSPRFNLAESIEEATKDIDRFELPKAVEAARNLFYKTNYDQLTGLLNKDVWRQQLEKKLQEGGDVGVLFIDLTNFKRINDEAPDKHETGDKVLLKVANILKHQFRTKNEDDLMGFESHFDRSGNSGRVGGDEFAIILDLSARTDEWDQKEPAERMDAIMERLNEDFARLKHEDPTLSQYGFDVAIGGAVSQKGMDASALLAQADHAMSPIKEQQHQANGQYR